MQQNLKLDLAETDSETDFAEMVPDSALDFPILGWDDFSNQGCICWMIDHGFAAVVGL